MSAETAPYSWDAEQAARLRELVAQLALYSNLPLPAPAYWPVFELEARDRLSRIWQLCRSITANEAMPTNLDAATSILRRLNEAPPRYPADPDAAPKQPPPGSHPYVLQPVAVLGPDGRDSGQTTWQRVTRS